MAIINSPWRNSRAIQFDGVASYGQISNTGFPTAAGSLSAWVKIDSALTLANSYGFVQGSTATSFFAFGKAGASNDLVIRGNFSSSGQTSLFRAGGHTVGQWYHFLATFDGTDFRAYIDGVNYNSISRSGQTLSIAGMFHYFARASFFAPCTIDEVSIWDRAIAVNEVASGNSPISIMGTSGLVRYWRMGDRYVWNGYTENDLVTGQVLTYSNLNQNTGVIAL